MAMKTAELDLDAIRVRADGATPGPWEFVVVADREGKRTVLSIGGAKGWTPHELPDSAATFIAHARTDVPALVAEVKRLRRIVDDVVRNGCRGDALAALHALHGEPGWHLEPDERSP